MSAMASARIGSRNQCRIRRRRTDWYGIFCTNISDGKLDDVLPLALNQVHEDRNGDGGEAEEEERSQE